ncbi:hypothetical protein OESDEN_24199 [Oesophagostomum dentatum]|uniref:Uncharacterized protein n=1 Tax=Oesophagostomum dentatum TaxID=61180 RepID=A0A0B1RX41_OESDE|nr:hypothetical protein OESDEN_24199 [Oesophagostomum dentatum]
MRHLNSPSDSLLEVLRQPWNQLGYHRPHPQLICEGRNRETCSV